MQHVNFTTVPAPEVLVHIGISSLSAMFEKLDLEARLQGLREDMKGAFFIFGHYKKAVRPM